MSNKTFTIKTSRGLEDWSVIDSLKYFGETYYLLESNEYGDEVPCIIMDSKENIVEWDWFDTLADWINDRD